MKSFLNKRANQSARLEDDLDHALRAHFVSTAAEGSPFLAGLVNSDDNDPPSSPPRWPVIPFLAAPEARLAVGADLGSENGTKGQGGWVVEIGGSREGCRRGPC
jgi:hypothetical protein